MSADIDRPSPIDRRADVHVRDNRRALRFEAVLEDEIVGILTYERRRRVLEIVHTVTDPEHRRVGVASVLVRTVLAEARAQELQVRVICPFVESWLQRHPEQADGLIVD